jgi:hypothetical protein
LREEIGDLKGIIDHQTLYAEQVVDAGGRALAYLNSDEECVRGCEALLVDFFHSSQVWGASYDHLKYQESQRLGFPSNPETRSLIDTFYRFVSGSLINTTPPAYRERIRGHITPAATEALWRGCFDFVTAKQDERLTRGCVNDLKPLGAAAILSEIRADAALKPALQYWLVQNALAIRVNPEMSRHADAAMAALSDDIGDGE